MLQSHIFGQRADLATECRTLSRDLCNEWHPKAACCSMPRQPRADRSQLQLLHWHGTFINTSEKRWILPLCSFIHDELFPGSLFPTCFILLHFFKYSEQLNTSVRKRRWTSDLSKQYFLVGSQINASKDLWNLPQPLVYYYAKWDYETYINSAGYGLDCLFHKKNFRRIFCSNKQNDWNEP